VTLMSDLGRQVRTNNWVVGVFSLFLVLLIWKATLLPNFGEFQVQTILLTALTAALLAIAQAIIVIGGGIDLSVGAMMVLITAFRILHVGQVISCGYANASACSHFQSFYRDSLDG